MFNWWKHLISIMWNRGINLFLFYLFIYHYFVNFPTQNIAIKFKEEVWYFPHCSCTSYHWLFNLQRNNRYGMNMKPITEIQSPVPPIQCHSTVTKNKTQAWLQHIWRGRGCPEFSISWLILYGIIIPYYCFQFN